MVAADDSGPKARTAVILAGGEGKRLREFTRTTLGIECPKQFCPLLVGGRTLLETTISRIAPSFQPGRIATVLSQSHECFYTRLLSGTPSDDIVVQPENRGTGAAIVYALLRVARLSAKASVAVFPCDHYVRDERKFMSYVSLAFEAVTIRPELVVLLGITPTGPDIGYGWIEPAARVEAEEAPLFRIGRFWEKPSIELARRLYVSGSLWNSFVMVAQVSALMELVMQTIPHVYDPFLKVADTFGTEYERSVIERLYKNLDSTDFSADVLAKAPEHLAVLRVEDVKWSDLGTGERVTAVLADLRHGSTSYGPLGQVK